MANRVSVELNAQVKGFVDGMNQAADSTKVYETETKKVRDSLGSFNKELRTAKNDVKNLTLAYSQLDEVAKNSTFGKEMKRQLQDAEQKMADLVDMQGDLNEKIKNMASDTKTFDTMIAGMDIFMNTTAAAMGIVAQFTGKEEDARKAVVMFTTAQSTLNAVTKVYKQLLPQSTLMIQIQNLQNKAGAVAAEMKAAAETKGAIATKGATVAQKAFNLVAKANPYVLLATAIIAITAATYGFIAATRKSETAVQKANRAIHEGSVQGRKDATQEIAKLDVLYKRTQDVTVAKEERLAAIKKLQKEWPAYFGNMTQEQILLGKASEAYRRLKDDIIAVAQAKAYEQKIAKLAEENVDIEEQIEKQKELIKEREASARKNKGGFVPGMTSYGAKLGESNSIQSAKDGLKELEDQQKQNIALQEKLIDKINKTAPAQSRMDKNEESKKETNTKTTSTKTTKSDIEAAKNSIADLEKQISDLEEKARKGVLPEELRDPVKFKNKIKSLQSQVKELKIKWGFEDPSTKLQELQNDVDEAQKAFVLAVNFDDKQAQQEALKVFYAAQKKLNEYKLSITIEPQIDPATTRKQISEIHKIISDALKQDNSSDYDFSYLPDKIRESAEKTLKELERISDAKEKLNNIMNDESSSDAQIAAAQEGLTGLIEKYDELLEKVEAYNNLNQETQKLTDHTEKLAEKYDMVADAIGDVGSMFGALASLANDNPVLNVAAIVAEAVANVFAGYARATVAAIESTGNPWIWAAFSLSALAQTLGMVSQIKSATSGYANGGVVGGSSYSGDHILARVNSGELILNQRQQKNLFNLLDTDTMPQKGGTNVQVTGVIRGTDLILVQKNTNKVRAKSGTQIKF